MKMLFLSLSLFMVSIIKSQETGQRYLYSLKDKRSLSVEVCSPNILRIRISDRDDFPPSLLERYHIVRSTWDTIKVQETNKSGWAEIITDSMKLKIDKATGCLSLFSSKGKVLVTNISVMKEKTSDSRLIASLAGEFGNEARQAPIIGDIQNYNPQNKATADEMLGQTSVIAFDLQPDERFYGLGSASRQWIQHRGHAIRIWAQYQKSESPTPFIMSTAGWGIFHNTTLRHYFDVGKFDKNKMFVTHPSGNVDFYLMGGSTLAGVLKNYVEITGKPFILPRYAYGLCFGSNTMENQFDVMNNALRFRQENIPLDLYWIEPQWMAKWYDFSTQKNWDYKKFPGEPYWIENQFPKEKHHSMFIGRLQAWGVKVALWLCVDEDLTVAEENALAKASGNPKPEREIWSGHLTRFLDQGVVGFKIDPARTMDEQPDSRYYNGLSDAEMHQVNQVLVLKQVGQTCRNHTGMRPFLHYCGGYAGAQHWGAATCGDNGGGVTALMDQINLGMSGFVNTSCDMLSGENDSPAGIHFGFFLPWVQVNSWFELLHPWYLNDFNKEVFRNYNQLRYSLLPYIYSTALQGAQTGMPIVRAMPLVYPNDLKVADNSRQFMFGEHFLTAAFSSKIYLPEGNWIDFWTGKKYNGNQDVEPEIPASKGGPLFVKAGAIIPCQKNMRYSNEFSNDTIILKIYPHGKSSFTLLEDDGTSFDYETGKLARTDISCNLNNDVVNITISKRRGTYTDMPVHRYFRIELYSVTPEAVCINGRCLEAKDLLVNNDVVSCLVQTE